jgi:hypothetical protein
MKLTRNEVVLVAALFAILAGSSAMAKSNWQTMEFDYPLGPEYIDCLGEELSVYTWATIKYREFETQSGTYHYIEHWTWEDEWIGQETGRVWFGEGKSPGSFHAAKGEVGQWASSGMARPIVGEGPNIRYNQRFKYTFNANGDLRVFFEPPESLNDTIRCVGKNN